MWNTVTSYKISLLLIEGAFLPNFSYLLMETLVFQKHSWPNWFFPKKDRLISKIGRSNQRTLNLAYYVFVSELASLQKRYILVAIICWNRAPHPGLKIGRVLVCPFDNSYTGFPISSEGFSRHKIKSLKTHYLSVISSSCIEQLCDFRQVS